MKLSGSYQINLSKQKVWEALNDPEVLKKAIPGCEEFKKNSDTEFTATATNKIGPFNASFTGDIELTDLDPPNSYKITGSGNSPVGFASGEAKVKLEDSLKIGYDKDSRLTKAHRILNNKFKFFSKEEILRNHLENLKISNKTIVISMLNFVHNVSNYELKIMIDYYYKIIGPYILLLDNIYYESEEYKYNHHNYLFNHYGLIKYFHKVDKLRSLYCLRID